jgi:hypothetical protein
VKNNKEQLLKVADIHDKRRWALCHESSYVTSGGLFSPIKEVYGKEDFYGGNGLAISTYSPSDSTYDEVGYMAACRFV